MKNELNKDIFQDFSRNEIKRINKKCFLLVIENMPYFWSKGM